MKTLEPYNQSDYQVFPGCSPPDFAQSFLSNRIKVESFAMNEGIDLDALPVLVDAVLTEWELTEQTHRDRQEALKHLLNHIRIKKTYAKRNPTPRPCGQPPRTDENPDARMARIAEEILRQSAGGNQP